jgi:GT2 family glycosyltransferase
MMRMTSTMVDDRQLSVRDRPRGIAVICTKDRPNETEMSCAAAHAASPHMPILVVDASTTDQTQRVCKRLTHQHGSALTLVYRKARRPGLARQRNEAVAACRELGIDIVHFIDDDTEVSPGYFDAIERRFLQDPTVVGIGGIINNQPTIDWLPVRSFFLLRSRRRGSVLRSGRNMLGQYPDTQASDHVDWLNGCSMSYRLTAFDHVMFDDRLKGPSLGEDYDFSFRLSRKHKLAVEPEARCIHHVTPTVRSSRRAVARQGTENTYRWVIENRALGMSRLAFWWATFGDVVLHAAGWVIRRRTDSLQEILGVLEAATAIVSTSRPGTSSRPTTR